MTEEQRQALAEAVMRKATEYAADPTKGRAAGYRPEQELAPNPTNYGFDRAPPIPARDTLTAWLYGVARRDLRDYEYTIIAGPEDSEVVVIGRKAGR